MERGRPWRTIMMSKVYNEPIDLRGSKCLLYMRRGCTQRDKGLMRRDWGMLMEAEPHPSTAVDGESPHRFSRREWILVLGARDERQTGGGYRIQCRYAGRHASKTGGCWQAGKRDTESRSANYCFASGEDPAIGERETARTTEAQLANAKLRCTL